ncbi:COMM domain-containing protein 1, partial [Phlebotomus argentipes]|uniref:COMM domain-containing protein 1 n=1 Tax=Phlebotomus argentipes TaxID=94469 RepID=UPI002892A825
NGLDSSLEAVRKLTQGELRNILTSSTHFRLLECIQRINEQEDETFQQILNFVYECKVVPNPEISVEEALKDLQDAVKLEDESLLMAIKTLSHVFKRALKFIMKPTSLHVDLIKVLGFEEKKADAIIKYWVQVQKPILDNLGTESGQTKELEDVSWNLEVDLASEAREKEKNPVGVIQMKISTGDLVAMQCNHIQLSKFFDQLEEVTQELDNLKKS